jgi:hypothetical protein
MKASGHLHTSTALHSGKELKKGWVRLRVCLYTGSEKKVIAADRIQTQVPSHSTGLTVYIKEHTYLSCVFSITVFTTNWIILVYLIKMSPIRLVFLRLVFSRWAVRIWSGTPDIPTEVLVVFLSPSRLVFRWGYISFFSSPFQFIIYQSGRVE